MFFYFMDAVTIFSDFGDPKIKSLTVSIVSPSICHEVMGLDAMIFIFERLFSSSLLSAIGVVSSAYLKLLLFLLTVLIPACDSSRVASAYKLNKQGHNIQLSATHSHIDI